MSEDRPDVYRAVVSNGFNKFHLSVAAEELARRGRLDRFITGAYPHGLARCLTAPLGRVHPDAVLRFNQRLACIPPHLISSQGRYELVDAIGGRLTRPALAAPQHSRIRPFTSNLYGHRAARIVRALPPTAQGVFHYRAGFGHASVSEAKRRGWIAVCDHSIAHPAVLEALTGTGGTVPEGPVEEPVSRVERLILEDIQHADHLLFNSEFIRSTFAHQPEAQIPTEVIYWGIDNQFLGYLDENPGGGSRKGATLHCLFAGALTKRKGADVLLEAFAELAGRSITLDVAGPVLPDLRTQLRDALRSPQIRHLGNLSRRGLAGAMRSADVLVFPSLAEGSARVIFEALAAGCWVITTPNSGSVVGAAAAGKLIPPANAAELSQAVLAAAEDVTTVRNGGAANQELVRAEFTQRHYGQRLDRFFASLRRQ